MCFSSGANNSSGKKARSGSKKAPTQSFLPSVIKHPPTNAGFKRNEKEATGNGTIVVTRWMEECHRANFFFKTEHAPHYQGKKTWCPPSCKSAAWSHRCLLKVVDQQISQSEKETLARTPGNHDRYMGSDVMNVYQSISRKVEMWRALVSSGVTSEEDFDTMKALQRRKQGRHESNTVQVVGKVARECLRAIAKATNASDYEFCSLMSPVDLRKAQKAAEPGTPAGHASVRALLKKQKEKEDEESSSVMFLNTCGPSFARNCFVLFL